MVSLAEVIADRSKKTSELRTEVSDLRAKLERAESVARELDVHAHNSVHAEEVCSRTESCDDRGGAGADEAGCDEHAPDSCVDCECGLHDLRDIAARLLAALSTSPTPAQATAPETVHPSNLPTVIDLLETEREELRADRDKWKRYAHTSAAGFKGAVARIQSARDATIAAIDAFDEGDGDALDAAHQAILKALDESPTPSAREET
jgi:hypothetical protein